VLPGRNWDIRNNFWIFGGRNLAELMPDSPSVSSGVMQIWLDFLAIGKNKKSNMPPQEKQ